jgi:hypothetical protein
MTQRSGCLYSGPPQFKIRAARHGEYAMKNSVLLTISSLLTILLLILHLTTEIAFGLESGGLKNITRILILVVWLIGTLLLLERKLGYVIVLVGSLLGTVVPIIHMMGGLVGGRIGHTHLALFWVFSNFLLGVTALFSVILSARGLLEHLQRRTAGQHKQGVRA